MPRSYAGARIGIDLDNTIITYDRLFLELALARELVPLSFRGSKREIRDHIRCLPDGELEWQRLQAAAYGPSIDGASPSDGALEFIREARLWGAGVVIVSHKTPYSNLGSERVSFHDAARRWLTRSGIVADDAVLGRDVYFELTRDAKIKRIRNLRCTHFIDDLVEVLSDANFPAEVERMLLSATDGDQPAAYRAYASFREIAHAFTS